MVEAPTFDNQIAQEQEFSDIDAMLNIAAIDETKNNKEREIINVNEIRRITKPVSDLEFINSYFSEKVDVREFGGIYARAQSLQAACFAHNEGSNSPSNSIFNPINNSVTLFDRSEHKKGEHGHCKNCKKDLKNSEKNLCSDCQSSEGGE